MSELVKVLDKWWEELRKYPNVINLGMSTKFVDGKDTGLKCITAYVIKKVPKSLLFSNEIIPKELEGVPIDVIELSPVDWKAGETEVSKKHPLIQRRIAGGVKK